MRTVAKKAVMAIREMAMNRSRPRMIRFAMVGAAVLIIGIALEIGVVVRGAGAVSPLATTTTTYIPSTTSTTGSTTTTTVVVGPGSSPYELYCPGTPVGTVVLNDVVTSGLLSTSSPSSGQGFDVDGYQTVVPIPAAIVQAMQALGNTSITGSASTEIDATGATPSSIATGTLNFSVPIPTAIPSSGVDIEFPSSAMTIGPFTATSSTVTLSEDSSTDIALVVTTGSPPLGLVCTSYPDDDIPTSGITTSEPSGNPIAPVIASSTGGTTTTTTSTTTTTTTTTSSTTTTTTKPTTTTTTKPTTTTTTKPTTTTTTKPTTTTSSTTSTTSSTSSTTTSTTQASGTSTSTTAPATSGSGSAGSGSSSSGVTSSSESLAFTGASKTLNAVAMAGGALVLLGLLMLSVTGVPRRAIHRLSLLVRRN